MKLNQRPAIMGKNKRGGSDMQIKKMECPGCGADLRIDSDASYCICEYCGTQIAVHNENRREFVYRDVARLKELELREEQRKRDEEAAIINKQKDDLANALSILTSDEGASALKSVGKLALKFLKKGL